IEIGEAVKALPAELLAGEPALPWAQIAGMRDRLAHRYFDTSHAILAATVSEDLPELDTSVRRLLQRVDDDT
ncbi:MAG: HepT-like ribonuclease domain-containing protein, partial [Acidimicrobiales bacterium]